MSMPAIVAEGLGKRYALGRTSDRGYHTLRDSLAAMLRRRPRPSAAAPDVWALHDVSFAVDEGEALGVIGHNGAGKSTLLKILARVTEPTLGRAQMRGRVASLLEVGTGFHPELTGRENVYLNGALLGMTRAEVRRHFDAIVAFAEVERFLDTPVKHYSSGMHVRLGFAVAAHLTPEILIVDEVLAVGDLEFQRRCLGRMHEVAHSGRTVLFVSHNLRAIETLCTRTLLLRAGQVESLGPTPRVIERYVATQARASYTDLASYPHRDGTGRARITGVELLAAHSEARLDVIPFRQPFRLRIAYAVNERVPGAVIGFAWVGLDGERVWLTSTEEARLPLTLTPGGGHIDCRVQSPNVLPREYRLELWITDPQAGNYADHLASVGSIVVATDSDQAGRLAHLARNDRGSVFVDCEWQAPVMSVKEA